MVEFLSEPLCSLCSDIACEANFSHSVAHLNSLKMILSPNILWVTLNMGIKHKSKLTLEDNYRAMLTLWNVFNYHIYKILKNNEKSEDVLRIFREEIRKN